MTELPFSTSSSLSIAKTLLNEHFDMIRWLVFKKNPPPHTVKVATVLKYADAFSADCLVETGTYMGQMIEKTKHRFKKIISIELDERLFETAKKKFSTYDKIQIYHGASDEILPLLILSIHEPIIFWLDAHYSGGITAKGKINTPIMMEIASILKHPCIGRSVILIDDARCFNGTNDYPSIDELEKVINQTNPNLKMFIEDDIIRIHKIIE